MANRHNTDFFLTPYKNEERFERIGMTWRPGRGPADYILDMSEPILYIPA